MARLPTLVSILADRDSRERTTIEQMARYIREAGYVATTKRGLGASAMTAKDAANLLIGIAASESPKNAAIEVARKTTLRRVERSDAALNGAFHRIDRAATFGEAMEALIGDALVIEARFLTWIDQAYPQLSLNQLDAAQSALTALAGVRVVFGPISASIIVFKQGRSGEEIECVFRYTADIDLFMSGFYGATNRSYRTVSVEIGFDIILDLAKAIAPEVQGND